MTDSESPRGLRLIIVGASGVVGSHVLAQALAHPGVALVVAPTRRALTPQNRLENPVVDFARLSATEHWWQVDAVICTLGSTIRQAGSQAAFAAIDRDLVVAFGANARAAGASRFGLNSSLGASLSGNFYLRTKAEAEAGIRALSYPHLTIVRPSLIDAKRETARPGEAIGLFVAHWLRPLIPRRYRAVRPEWIASALLDGVLSGRTGERTIESEDLQH